jgi:hypothetical protein
LRERYENAPWLPHNALEFTPQYSVTHVQDCRVCNSFKEHIIIAKAIEGKDSFAWKARDKFEQDLMSLGWAMALVEGDDQTMSFSTLNTTLEHENHRL